MEVKRKKEEKRKEKTPLQKRGLLRPRYWSTGERPDALGKWKRGQRRLCQTWRGQNVPLAKALPSSRHESLRKDTLIRETDEKPRVKMVLLCQGRKVVPWSTGFPKKESSPLSIELQSATD